MNISEKKNALSQLAQEKTSEVNALERKKNNLSVEIIELQGQIKLLTELEREQADKKEEK